MIELVRARLERLEVEWENRAVLLERHGAGMVAATLRQAQQDLSDAVNQLDRETAYLTVEQYAAAHAVAPDTVRRWIRAGQLAATKGATGYQIQRTAVRRKAPRARSVA